MMMYIEQIKWKLDVSHTHTHTQTLKYRVIPLVVNQVKVYMKKEQGTFNIC